jgi:hypothetical protein
MGRTREKIEEFASRPKPAYTILEAGDVKSQLAYAYGVNNGMGSATIPYCVLIRPDGTVAYVLGGYDPSLEKQVTRLVTAGQ